MIRLVNAGEMIPHTWRGLDPRFEIQAAAVGTTMNVTLIPILAMIFQADLVNRLAVAAHRGGQVSCPSKPRPMRSASEYPRQGRHSTRSRRQPMQHGKNNAGPNIQPPARLKRGITSASPCGQLSCARQMVAKDHAGIAHGSPLLNWSGRTM